MVTGPMPDERALMERAHKLDLQGNEDEALGIVSRILQTNPNNMEASRAFTRLQRSQPTKHKVDNREITPPNNQEIQELVRQNQELKQQVQQRAGQPVVQITNQVMGNKAAYVSPAPVRIQAERNNGAFIVGVIAGFIGFLGLAHLFNGKIGTGLALLFLGTPIYGAFWLLVVGTGLGIFALPLHFVIIWHHAKSGAAYT